MRKYFTGLYIIFIFTTLDTACISHRNSIDPARPKKFYVKPVVLSVKGIHEDTSILKIFKVAFEKRNVKLISQDEALLLTKVEGKRVFEKIKASKKEFTTSEQFVKSVGDELNYVSNMLSIMLELESRDDSMIIYKASWSNIPMPPNINRPAITRQREIHLENLPIAIKGNIYSIVDSILYSKELY